VIGHISPGFFELVEDEPYVCPMHNAKYIELVQGYKDVISGQFFGHHHTDSFRLFYDKANQPVSWLFAILSWRSVASPCKQVNKM